MHIRPKIKIVFVLTLTFVGLTWMSASANDLKTKTKAVFLYKLFHFVTWPEPKQRPGEDESQICIYGRNPFGSALDYLKETQKGFIVQNISRPDQVDNCHLLFIGTVDDSLPLIIQNAKSHGILTVSDIPQSFDQGTMILFSFESDRLGFNINRTQILDAGLQISSKLLRIARVIK